jgi:hypothetical protein
MELADRIERLAAACGSREWAYTSWAQGDGHVIREAPRGSVVFHAILKRDPGNDLPSCELTVALHNAAAEIVSRLRCAEEMENRLSAILTDNAQDALEDPIGNAKREREGFCRIAYGTIGKCRQALSSWHAAGKGTEERSGG